MKTFIAMCLMTLILQGTVDSSVAQCPDRYIPLGTGCYYFSLQEHITWHQAYFICRIQLKGSLVEIESQQEQNDLKHYIETEADPVGKYVFWLGATDLLEEGEFRWMTSGKLLSFNGWYATEPNNFRGNEDCAMFYKGHDYMWYDFDCNDTNWAPTRVICEPSQIK